MFATCLPRVICHVSSATCPCRDTEYSSFKVMDICKTKKDIKKQGLSICITTIDQCASIKDFCYGRGKWCRYAFYSPDFETCCPVGDTLAQK